MQLLSPKTVHSKKKLENEALIDSNIRLRRYEQGIVKRLNTLRDSYEPDKLQKLEEFERYCKDLQAKKEKVLQELAQWQELVKTTKEIYYGMVARQDELQEIKYQIDEENKKLNLREIFISDLETKWRNKQ